MRKQTRFVPLGYGNKSNHHWPPQKPHKIWIIQQKVQSVNKTVTNKRTKWDRPQITQWHWNPYFEGKLSKNESISSNNDKATSELQQFIYELRQCLDRSKPICRQNTQIHWIFLQNHQQTEIVSGMSLEWSCDCFKMNWIDLWKKCRRIEWILSDLWFGISVYEMNYYYYWDGLVMLLTIILKPAANGCSTLRHKINGIITISDTFAAQKSWLQCQYITLLRNFKRVDQKVEESKPLNDTHQHSLSTTTPINSVEYTRWSIFPKRTNTHQYSKNLRNGYCSEKTKFSYVIFPKKTHFCHCLLRCDHYLPIVCTFGHYLSQCDAHSLLS